MTETELLEHVRTEAARLGLLAVHRHDSRRDTGWTGGFPDVVIASPAGRGLLFAELKSDGGQLSRDQQRWRWAIEACGYQFLLWRPVHWTSGEIGARLRMLVQP